MKRTPLLSHFLLLILACALAGGTLFIFMLVIGAPGPAAARQFAQVDLGIRADDGLSQIARGQVVSYRVVLSNPGSTAVFGARFTNTLPPGLPATEVSYATSGQAVVTPSIGLPTQAGGTANLLPGGVVTMLITGTVSNRASGTLTNNAVVVLPSGQVDENPNDNTSADVDTVVLPTSADLAITQTNGLTQVVAGAQVVYVITVANNSLATVLNSLFVDELPANSTAQQIGLFSRDATTRELQLVTGQPIRFTADFDANGLIQLTLTGTVNFNATGLLTNTARISGPAEPSDPNPANNTATDADPIQPASGPPTSDLQIGKTDGVTEVLPGQLLTYTVFVTNAGAFGVDQVRVTDTLPVPFKLLGLTGSGTGGISQFSVRQASAHVVTATANLQANATLRLILTGTLAMSATGPLGNTAVVTSLLPLTEMNPANNTALDVDLFVGSLPPRAYLPVVFK